MGNEQSWGFGESWKTLLCALLLLLLLALSACQEQRAGQDAPETEGMEQAAMDIKAMPESVPPPPPPSPGAEETDAGTPRKLLRTARLSLQVEDVAVAAAAVAKTLDRLGGFVAAEETNDYDGSYLTMSLRVPAESLDTLLAATIALAERVEQRSVQVVDATTEYVDVAARLATQRALEQRLRELLARASKVSDVLEVEREFARVTADIEAYEARLKSIDRQATFATLDLTLHSERGETIVTRKHLGSELAEALRSGGHGLREMLIFLVGLWPLWLAIAAGGLMWRRARR